MSSRRVDELFSLDGRIALVTGAAGSGYGIQAATALAEAGAEVIVTSRQAGKARSAADQLREQGLLASGMQLELTSEADVSSVLQSIERKHGSLDILVNNACENHLESFETVELSDWDRVLSVNITGTMLVTRASARLMLNGDGGSILNISSIYGVVSPDRRIYGTSGIESPLVYGVSKAAILQMTRYLATYWAPRIRVNSITPGGLYAEQDQEFVANYVSRTPMGRMAGPNDLKGAVVYLASDASAWVTGQNLIVDGGWTVW